MVQRREKRKIGRWIVTLSNFWLSLLIVKDDLVVTRVVGVEEHPAVARVVRVFVRLYSSIGDTELRRGGDTDEGGRNIRAFSVLLDAVSERLDPGKVNDGIVVVNGNGG